jgi:hypothetical protein
MKRIFATGLVMLVTACAPSAAPTGTVSGTYRIDGTDSKLSFTRAAKGEPYMKEPTIDIAFSEKDPAAAKDLMAIRFGKTYGSYIAITLYKTKEGTYDVISSSFSHPSLKMAGGGSGIVNVKDVKEANGEMSGELVTKPNTTLFDQKYDIDLKFKVPLPK